MKTFIFCLGILILGALGLNARRPYFILLRPVLPFLLPLFAILLFRALGRIPWSERHPRLRGILRAFILFLAFCPLYQRQEFELRKQALFRAPTEQAQKYGRHLVVGYRSYGDLKQLVEKGLVGGVFLAPWNIQGKNFDQVRREIAELQEIQRSAGRPPLWIMSDQEGGEVSKLSPLISHQDNLGELLSALPEEEWDGKARAYAALQGEQLAALGVNVNLSPVVDLKRPRLAWDAHSRIDQRALASQPEQVAKIALAYAQALEAKGVYATLKHFPGLGSVETDTHLYEGILGSSPEFLSQRDWLPFREVLAQSRAFLMLGHVRLLQVDAENPASVSAGVIQGILREEWRFQGPLITDDFAMAPLYSRAGGVGKAAVDALNAGADLLLVSYDGELYYEMMEALLQADREGRMRDAVLAESERRLQAAAPSTLPSTARAP